MNNIVLVTGGSGFLGKHLVTALSGRGTSARGLWTGTATYVANPTHVDCDLRDGFSTESLFEEHHPRWVVHAAASCGGIGANRKRPADFIYDNLKMGLNVMEACKVYEVERLILLGTVCSYPERPRRIPFQEEDLWTGYPEPTNAPYGIAKRALYEAAQAYYKQYDLKTIVLIPTNMYGMHDHFDLETSHVIPALFRKFITAKEPNLPSVTLWGTGTATREFLYVEDCVDAIVAALRMKYPGPQPFNLGSGEEISIGALAQEIRHLVGYNGSVDYDPSKPDGQPRRAVDSTRALEHGMLSTHRVKLEEGLRTTYEWIKLYRSEHAGAWPA